MASSGGTNETECLLKEYDQLTELLSQIPNKVQRGIKMQHEILELTCLDANQQLIALGSNIGTVFLYDREKHTIQRLKPDNTFDSATCVSLHHGLNDCVAIGYLSGAIYIFQLPSILPGHSKELERFAVPDLHEASLRTLTWSINGMKLFSGDVKGSVGCTEVDFIEGRCTSSVLMIEVNTEIVQLNQAHKSLVVSTKHRCIVCRMDCHDKLVQVGSKDRKILGDFGACFIPAMCKPDDAQLYAARPGLRIWKASINGTVTNTFMFKDILSQDTHEIPIQDFTITSISKSNAGNQFGPVLMFQDKGIVTWNNSCLYVLDADNMTVTGTQSHLGNIIAVAVSDEEIFILRSGTDRNVVRIATKPLPKSSSALLKQLQEERRERELKEVEERDRKLREEEVKQAQHKSSPFKVLQGNIMDKVKQIPKPAEIKDKIQEKLNLDKSDSKTYCAPYEFNVEDKALPAVSPLGELPPVVHLESPELLKLSIGAEVSEVSPNEKFSDLAGVSSQYEAEIHNVQAEQRTGTGAISALARLQEDHETEQRSEPVYRITDSAESTPVRQPRFEVSGEADDDGDIVFSRKTKTKHKKKKGAKDKTPISSEPDRLSLTSSTSATSESEISVQSQQVTAAATDHQEAVSSVPVTRLDSPTDHELGTTDKVISDVVDTPGNPSSTHTENIQDSSVKNETDEDIKDEVLNSDTVTEQHLEETQYPAYISDEKDVVASNDTRNISNLDKEIENLNEYISDKGSVSDVKAVEAGKDKFDYSSDLSTNYEPSSLDKELNMLELAAETGNFDMEMAASDTSKTPEPTTPSIYTVYGNPGSPMDDLYSAYSKQSPETSRDRADTSDTHTAEEIDTRLKDEFGQSVHISENPQSVRSVNIWAEMPAHGNIHSLSVSHSHVWITDRSWNIYYSPLTGEALGWKKASGSGSQIAVSRDGNIVWCLRKNTVYAGTKITPKRPEGMKWVAAVQDVACISVDETCAWYIKTSYEVMMQKGLSKERPCYTAQAVPCSKRLKQIVCKSGVVWALTETCQWLYRSGISAQCPEGMDWKEGDKTGENLLFTNISLGDENLGWAVDVIGQVWFCCGVTMETPRGDGKWWQVPLGGEYLMKDMTTIDMLKSFSRNFDPQKLAFLISAQSGGLVCGVSGLWVCPEYKNILHICRGSLEGQHWREAHPLQMSSTSSWKIVVAINATHDSGTIWAEQPTGDLFALTADRRICANIERPQDIRSLFVSISACQDALWALTADGEVFIRTGMSVDVPRGLDWCNLDLSQLDESQLVHVSCGSLNVWAVDSDGSVFHRIGVKAPTDLCLNAAWLPVDNGGTVFTAVMACQQDWKVWAVDNKRQVYVREGITTEMPIGRSWIHVPGTPAMHLALSGNHVWALNSACELLCRYGVSQDNVAGDYWKKLPGSLVHISATPDDMLWGITKQGQLVKRHTRYILKKGFNLPNTEEGRQTVRRSRTGSDDGDWTLL